MWEAHEGMGWWMLFGSIFWLIVIVAIVYAAAALPGRDGSSRGQPAAESALDIARRRYAAGEISEEDLRRIRENLKS